MFLIQDKRIYKIQFISDAQRANKVVSELSINVFASLFFFKIAISLYHTLNEPVRSFRKVYKCYDVRKQSTSSGCFFFIEVSEC